MTYRRRHVVVLVSLLALASCKGFSTSNVPVVETGKGEHPVPDGEYTYFATQTATLPIQTGVYLAAKEDHYEVRYLATSKTTISAGILRQTFARSDPKENAEFEDALSKLKTMSEYEFLNSVGAASLTTSSLTTNVDNLTADQAKFLGGYTGFTLGTLEKGYYVYQTPASFAPERWPRSDANEKPEWTIRVAKIDGTSIQFLDSSEACLSASKALFGTTPSCDNEGKCTDQAKVDSFTDTPDLNRQIVLRAVKQFASELRPNGRLARVQ
jgi:hypothetical protein